MPSKPEAVRRWRHKMKQRVIDSLGGQCICCGYSRCQGALHAHHLDPSTKEFGLGAIRGNPASWSKIVVELRKCVLLCGNCHSEVHEGIRQIPIDATRFNEDFVTYK